MRLSLLVPLVSFVSLVLGLVATPALAKRQPADVFGGRVMTSEKPYPSSSRSSDAYVAQVKKQSKDRFMEDKEKQEWRIYYAAFFKKPVNDMELKVTVYDATDKRFIASWEEYMTERGQRAIVGRMNLKREEGKLDANTKLLLVMESGGKIVASCTFYVVGEAKKRSGRADFSDDETKEKDSE